MEYLDLIVLAVLGALGLGVAFFKRASHIRENRSPIIPGPSVEQKKAEEKAAERVVEAEAERSKAVIEASADREAGVSGQLQELQVKKPELLEDPDALNQHLLDVGKKVRSGS